MGKPACRLSVAACLVDDYLFLCADQCRASGLYAHLAIFALVLIDHALCLVQCRELIEILLAELLEYARPSCDENCRLILAEELVKSSFDLIEVVRVDGDDVLILYADSLAECRDIYLRSFLAHESVSCARVLLVACHTCDTVVEDDRQIASAVIYSIHQRVDAGVEECGVSDDGSYLCSLACILEDLGCSMALRERSSHTDSGVDCAERRCHAECITPDVAGYHEIALLLSLGEAVEQSSVRAACTECRRSYDRLHVSCVSLRLYSEECLPYYICVELVESWNDILACALDAEHLYMLFDVRIHLFNYIDLVYLAAEVFDQIIRHRECEAQLQIGSVLFECFSCILIRNAGGDDTDLCVVHLNSVELAVVSEFS